MRWVTGSAEAGSLTPARWSMLDLGVAKGFTRRPTQAFEVSDVQEGQFASECRMHDQFLLSRGIGAEVRRYGCRRLGRELRNAGRRRRAGRRTGERRRDDRSRSGRPAVDGRGSWFVSLVVGVGGVGENCAFAQGIRAECRGVRRWVDAAKRPRRGGAAVVSSSATVGRAAGGRLRGSRRSRRASQEIDERTLQHVMPSFRLVASGHDVNDHASAPFDTNEFRDVASSLDSQSHGPIEFRLLPDSAEVGSDGALSIGGCSLLELASSFGTPLFVYDADHIRTR